MTSKEAIKLARKEFQKDFLDGEETNEWLSLVIKGLEQAENDLEILEILKKYLRIEPTWYPCYYAYDEEKIVLDIKVDNMSGIATYRGLASWIDKDEFNKVKGWLLNESLQLQWL